MHTIIIRTEDLDETCLVMKLVIDNNLELVSIAEGAKGIELGDAFSAESNGGFTSQGPITRYDDTMQQRLEGLLADFDGSVRSISARLDLVDQVIADQDEAIAKLQLRENKEAVQVSAMLDDALKRLDRMRPSKVGASAPRCEAANSKGGGRCTRPSTHTNQHNALVCDHHYDWYGVKPEFMRKADAKAKAEYAKHRAYREQAAQMAWLAGGVACPTCGAKAGSSCVTASGNEYQGNFAHVARIRESNAVVPADGNI